MPLINKIREAIAGNKASSTNNPTPSSTSAEPNSSSSDTNHNSATGNLSSMMSGLSISSSQQQANREQKIKMHQERLIINGQQAIKMQKYLDLVKEKFNRKYELNQKARLSKSVCENFERVKTLGAGSFGRVILLNDKQNKRNYFAMKVMPKKQIASSGHISHIVEEKRILSAIENPFLIHLHSHFQDNSYVYLVLDYINGGELFTHLRKRKKFPESLARFYAAQVVLAFEYLHHMDIIYRDLKPENILLDSKGNLKIIDMGFAKRAKGIVWTLCGTPEYIAPEILMNRGYNKSVDWYAFGILLYEMVAGFTPYWADQHIRIYEKILEGKLRFPSSFTSELKDLIRHLLHKDLTYRYGNLKNGVNDIKDHPWFMEVDWMSHFKQEIKPQFIPKVDSDNSGDYNNFETIDDEPLVIAETNEFGDAFSEF